MNKQEAMEIALNHKVYMMGQYKFNHYVPFEVVEDIIGKLDAQEVQKVVIPRYVSEWIEECKALRKTFYYAITLLNIPTFVGVWLGYSKNAEIFARAWIDGYEVEEEKLYTVEIPDPNRKGTNRIYLGKSNPNSKVIIHKGNFNPKKNKNLWLTEEEIKKDFDWAWQFAVPVEKK